MIPAAYRRRHQLKKAVLIFDGILRLLITGEHHSLTLTNEKLLFKGFGFLKLFILKIKNHILLNTTFSFFH